MTYLIYGSLAYTTQAIRNAAQTSINSVLASYSVANVATGGFAAGVATSGTTGLTISIRCNNEDIDALRTALITAWTSGTRATTGHYISEVKEK